MHSTLSNIGRTPWLWKNPSHGSFWMGWFDFITDAVTAS